MHVHIIIHYVSADLIMFSSELTTSSSVHDNNMTSPPLPESQTASRVSGFLIAVVLFVSVIAILTVGTTYVHKKERSVPDHSNINAGSTNTILEIRMAPSAL